MDPKIERLKEEAAKAEARYKIEAAKQAVKEQAFREEQQKKHEAAQRLLDQAQKAK